MSASEIKMGEFFTFDKTRIENESEDSSDVERDDDDDVDDSDLDINPLNIKFRNETTKTKNDRADPDDIDLEQFESDMGWTNKKKKAELDKPLKSILDKVNPVKDILRKSVIRSSFERHKRVPKYDPSDKKLKLARKREREKTKGNKWYNLPATEMTDEIKRDLEILQKRSALDPKHFYKKNDMKVLPKYFHVGKVVDSPLDYYNGRLTKKERKRTIVDELMADAEFAKYNKRKYKEIIEEKNKTDFKARQRLRRLKRKKKN